MKKMFYKKLSKNTKFLLLSTKSLDRRERTVILILIFVQITLSILDLIGVALLGLVGAISISGIQSAKQSNQIGELLNFLNLENFAFQLQVAVLATFAAFFLFTRTALSIYFTRRTLFYFAGKAAQLSGRIIERLLSRDLLFLTRIPNQETIFATTLGCNILMVGIFAQAINLISDFALLLTLGVGIFLVQPSIALTSVLIFSFSAAIMHFFLNTRAQKLGQLDSFLNIQTNSKLLEVLISYREIYVHNQRNHFAQQVKLIRNDSAKTQAELAFLPNISKYIVESTLLLGALIVSAIQFITLDAKSAITALALFLAAGTRLAPALLRVQQGMLSVRNSLGGVQSTLNLIQDLNSTEDISLDTEAIKELPIEKFIPEIIVQELNLKYPNSDEFALHNVSLTIPKGSIVAVVGPSGAGKTSLIDVMLGIIEPTSGQIEISQRPPKHAIALWPNAISYVPQESFISNSSLKVNVAMGFPLDDKTDQKVIRALEKAQLLEFAQNLPLGIETQVGENGGLLSGGQRQRLGIARALFCEPRLLILDEATSSLDAETEQMISESINALRGETTVVLIAHRLSTVRNADLVIYLEDGALIAQGNFEEVRKKAPQFDKQAKLMGL